MMMEAKIRGLAKSSGKRGGGHFHAFDYHYFARQHKRQSGVVMIACLNELNESLNRVRRSLCCTVFEFSMLKILLRGCPEKASKAYHTTEHTEQYATNTIAWSDCAVYKDYIITIIIKYDSFPLFDGQTELE